jgi:hypothetical protein
MSREITCYTPLTYNLYTEYNQTVNETQRIIKELKSKSWSAAALGDALGVDPHTVRRWDWGLTEPTNAHVVHKALRELLRRKRVPKLRRYKPGQRRRKQA